MFNVFQPANANRHLKKPQVISIETSDASFRRDRSSKEVAKSRVFCSNYRWWSSSWCAYWTKSLINRRDSSAHWFARRTQRHPYRRHNTNYPYFRSSLEYELSHSHSAGLKIFGFLRDRFPWPLLLLFADWCPFKRISFIGHMVFMAWVIFGPQYLSGVWDATIT